jgi:hypothetical protein
MGTLNFVTTEFSEVRPQKSPYRMTWRVYWPATFLPAYDKS